MRALVLSGGGPLGAYQAGAMKAFYESGVRWDVVVGVSVGAVNGIAYSYSENPELLTKAWLSIRSFRDVLEVNPIWKFWKVDAIFNFNPLRCFLKDLIDSSQTPKLPSYSCYVDFKDGRVKYVSHIDEPSLEGQIEAVVASSAVVGLQSPSLGLGFDGGHMEFAPVRFAIEKLNANQVDLILTNPMQPNYGVYKPWKFFPIVSHLARGFELATGEVSYNDWKSYETYPNLKILAPEKKLSFGGISYSPKNISYALELGYYDAMRSLK